MSDRNVTLSLCMIVKNEEALLGECLRAANSYCDELIVVDTGSTDRTIEITKQAGAKIFNFEWVDDFSAARNFSLEQAKSNWILVLDADERLTDDHWKYIRNYICESSKTACDLRQINYSNQMNLVGFVTNALRVEGFSHYKGYTQSWLTRLFKNAQGYHFKGVVHEHLYSKDQLVEGERLLVDIHHHGQALASEKMQEKRANYLKLGIMKAQSLPNDFKAQHEAGIASWENGLHSDALAYFERAFLLNPNHVSNLFAYALVAQSLKDYTRAENLFTKILALQPTHKNIHAALGRLHQDMGDFGESIEFYKQQILTHPEDQQCRNWLYETYNLARQKSAYKPTLTVCYIVKNEEDCLGRSLDNVLSHADEVIVMDTGSTDKTVSVAESKGAIVRRVKWQDDFAHARNESLKHATSEWILVLDADEVLSQQDWDQLHLLLQTAKSEMYYLIQTTYTDKPFLHNWKLNDLKVPEAQGYAGYFESSLNRLFRNSPQIRFHGAVHEHAECDDPKKIAEHTSIRIHHYGKNRSEQRMDEKSDLYCRIGLKKLQEMPENSHAIYEMAMQFWELEEFERADQYFQQALEVDPNHENARALYGCFLHQQGRLADAMDMFIGVIQRNPLNAEAHFYISSVLIDLGKNEFALEMIAKSRSLGFSNEISYHMNYGLIMANLGRHAEAESSYMQALQHNQKCEPVIINLVQLYRKMNRKSEAFEYLNRLLSNHEASFRGHKIYAELSFETSDYSAAQKHFFRAHEIDPQSDTVIAQIIILSLARDDNAMRVMFEEKLLKLRKSPNHKTITEMLIKTYRHKNKLSETKKLQEYFLGTQSTSRQETL